MAIPEPKRNSLFEKFLKMLEITPIQTKQEQKEICGLCKIGFDPDCLAYGAKEDGRLLGVSQFRIFGGYAVIFDLANADGAKDFEALAAAGGAALRFIHSCKVRQVFMKTNDEELAKALKFKKDRCGEYRLDLDDYFNSPCSAL